MYRIEAELLIPGRGNPVGDGVVVLDGARISYAGPAGLAPATPGAPVTRVTTVMPGMWECHGHLLGTRTFDLGQLPLEPEAVRAARCARDLRAALDAGITSVRDVGGLGVYLARVVDEGVIDGPAIYGAGAVLSTTGGHGDLHSFPAPAGPTRGGRTAPSPATWSSWACRHWRRSRRPPRPGRSPSGRRRRAAGSWPRGTTPI